MLKDLPTEQAFEFYRSLIEWYISRREDVSYLEIGCNRGWLTCRIAPQVKRAVGVDIDYFAEWDELTGTHKNTKLISTASDDFFKSYDGENFDVIFIDGSHEHRQVFRDIVHAFQILEDDGLIIVHDTLPPDAEHTTVGLCGDAYKAIEQVRHQLGGVDVFTFPVRFGVTLLSNRAEYVN